MAPPRRMTGGRDCRHARYVRKPCNSIGGKESRRLVPDVYDADPLRLRPNENGGDVSSAEGEDMFSPVAAQERADHLPGVTVGRQGESLPYRNSRYDLCLMNDSAVMFPER